MRTSYVRARVELVHPNGSSGGLMEDQNEVTFTGLTPATNYTVMVTFVFMGGFVGPGSQYVGRTQDGSKSHDKSHDM